MHLYYTRNMQKGHKIFIKSYVFLFICVLYISFSEKLNRNIVTTPFAYYNFLLDAFFHGYAHIISYVTYDLSLFHGNWYLYWGPAPVLFILPFFTIAGISASDVFYTLFAGIINIFLFYFVLKEAETYFQYTLSFFSELFLIIGFSICSPNFLLSLTGNIWGTSQIVAALYLLLSYFFYFRFLNKKRKIFFLL